MHRRNFIPDNENDAIARRGEEPACYRAEISFVSSNGARLTRATNNAAGMNLVTILTSDTLGEL